MVAERYQPIMIIIQLGNFSTDDFLKTLKLMAARWRRLQGKKKEKLEDQKLKFAIL